VSPSPLISLFSQISLVAADPVETLLPIMAQFSYIESSEMRGTVFAAADGCGRELLGRKTFGTEPAERALWSSFFMGFLLADRSHLGRLYCLGLDALCCANAGYGKHTSVLQ